MIEVSVNGKTRQCDDSSTVEQALAEWGYDGNLFAVAINSEFVPRSNYQQRVLQSNDQIDIVSPVQGG